LLLTIIGLPLLFAAETDGDGGATDEDGAPHFRAKNHLIDWAPSVRRCR